MWNVISSLPYGTLEGISYYYLSIYIQQSDDSLLPSKNSSWHVYSGNFIIEQLSSSSTSSSAGSSRGSTFVPSATLSPSGATHTSSGPITTSSAGTGARRTTGQLGWGVLGLIGVLAMW